LAHERHDRAAAVGPGVATEPESCCGSVRSPLAPARPCRRPLTVSWTTSSPSVCSGGASFGKSGGTTVGSIRSAWSRA
jgi:hypothetical protein